MSFVVGPFNFLTYFYDTKFNVCSFVLSRSVIFTATTLMSKEFTAVEVISSLASRTILLPLTDSS